MNNLNYLVGLGGFINAFSDIAPTEQDCHVRIVAAINLGDEIQLFVCAQEGM